MRKSLALSIALMSLLATGTAHAGLIGLGVEGKISYGPTDEQANGWDISTIGGGLEFRSVADGNLYGANFGANRLVITDVERPRETASGWQMTFQLLSPAEFKHVTLLSSNFGNGLTFTLVGNVLTINWTGDQAYQALTRKERRELGSQKFRAVFGLTAQEEINPVPEPGALPLMAGGLLVAAFFGWRRRAADATL